MCDRILIVAPNWLGDVVMALPAIADVRRQFPGARLTMAARRSVADLFRLAPFIDAIVTLEWRGRWWQGSRLQDDVKRLRNVEADVALLLPNSFASAWLVRRAGIPERWGYAADLRGPLLTRPVPRPGGSRHQGAYYQHLTRELGIDSGPLEPVLTVPQSATDAARRLLIDRGWQPSRPMVAFAPGAAYGTAKRWPPTSVANVASTLVRERAAACVLVGSRADRETTDQIRETLPVDVTPHVLDITGETTLETLAGVMTLANACVSNDSGAMHVAAAVGTPLVAVFGPTNEYETAPLTRDGHHAVVLTHPVWCRPCMLRECPIDHRCMTRLTPERVYGVLTDLVHADLVRSVRLQPDLS
jgi:heptosyltransferase-2